MKTIEEFKGTIVLTNGEHKIFDSRDEYNAFVRNNWNDIATASTATEFRKVDEKEDDSKELEKDEMIEKFRLGVANELKKLFARIRDDQDEHYKYFENALNEAGDRLEQMVKAYIDLTGESFPEGIAFDAIKDDPAMTTENQRLHVIQKLNELDEAYSAVVEEYKEKRKKLSYEAHKLNNMFDFINGIDNMIGDYNHKLEPCCNESYSAPKSEAEPIAKVTEKQPAKVCDGPVIPTYSDFVNSILSIIGNSEEHAKYSEDYCKRKDGRCDCGGKCGGNCKCKDKTSNDLSDGIMRLIKAINDTKVD